MRKKHQSCLICSHQTLNQKGQYLDGNMVQCPNCNFVFAINIPSVDELISHYEGYGRNDYLSPITIKRYHELLDSFELYRQTNNLIDVGCGIGYFAEIAKERGWNVYGTEYTDEAIEICKTKGISMQQGKLNPDFYDKGSFDVLTSFEVIEHINNPQEEMQSFKTLLRKGGVAYITTPNFNSMSRMLSGPEWTIVCYPEHLSYYTPRTLDLLLRNTGFKKKKIETTGFSITRHKVAKKTIAPTSNIKATSEDEKLRGKMETIWYWKLIKKIVNGTLTFFGIGDAMKVLYVKE